MGLRGWDGEQDELKEPPKDPVFLHHRETHPAPTEKSKIYENTTDCTDLVRLLARPERRRTRSNEGRSITE
jgi:hypothetical protein